MNEIMITIQENSENDCNLLMQRLREAEAELALELDITVSEPYLWLTGRGKYFKLYYSDCRFIETDNRHLIFHYKGQERRQAGKISAILAQLPDSMFFRCNNSYIVNLSYVSEIVAEGDRYNILLKTGEILPLSRSQYQKCLARLKIL